MGSGERIWYGGLPFKLFRFNKLMKSAEKKVGLEALLKYREIGVRCQ